jgi:hypothetical protein
MHESPKHRSANSPDAPQVEVTLPSWLRVTRDPSWQAVSQAPPWPLLFEEIWGRSEQFWLIPAVQQALQRWWERFHQAGENLIARLDAIVWKQISSRELIAPLEGALYVEIGMATLAPPDMPFDFVEQRIGFFYETLIRRGL